MLPKKDFLSSYIRKIRSSKDSKLKAYYVPVVLAQWKVVTFQDKPALPIDVLTEW